MMAYEKGIAATLPHHDAPARLFIHIGDILFLGHKTAQTKVQKFMPHCMLNGVPVSHSVTEQPDDALIDHAGSYPIIGRFNANVKNRVMNQDRNDGGKLFQKLINFLSYRAD